APFITRGLMAQSPNGMVRHASFGAAGMAWSDVTEFSKFPQFKLVAVAEVDLNRTAELKKKFPEVTVYQDWRKLLDKEAKNIQSVNHYRLAVRLVQDGVISKIKETHSWCPKSWGDPAPLPANTDPVPAGFDWDLWQGVCSTRPYIGNAYYHPATWRKRLDFGT